MPEKQSLTESFSITPSHDEIDTHLKHANHGFYNSVSSLHTDTQPEGMAWLLNEALRQKLYRGIEHDGVTIKSAHSTNTAGHYTGSKEGRADLLYFVADRRLEHERRVFSFPDGPHQIRVSETPEGMQTATSATEILHGMTEAVNHTRADLQSALEQSATRFENEREEITNLLQYLRQFHSLGCLQNGHWRTPFSNEPWEPNLDYVSPYH